LEGQMGFLKRVEFALYGFVVVLAVYLVFCW